MVNQVAVKFVCFVLQRNPHLQSFVEIYDAMTQAARTRSFYNLGYEELSKVGISFSLLHTGHLERLISECRNSTLPEMSLPEKQESDAVPKSDPRLLRKPR